FDQQLHALLAPPFVYIEAISEPDLFDGGVRPAAIVDIECNTIEGPLRALRVSNDELQMLFADQTLLYQHELTVEQRLGKVLPPWPSLAQRLRQFERHLLRQQLAIAQQHGGEIVVA